MNDPNLLDMTVLRKGSRHKGRKIEVCPRCKRKGQYIKYSDGTSNYVHKFKANIFGLLTAKENCYFKASNN